MYNVCDECCCFRGLTSICDRVDDCCDGGGKDEDEEEEDEWSYRSEGMVGAESTDRGEAADGAAAAAMARRASAGMGDKKASALMIRRGAPADPADPTDPQAPHGGPAMLAAMAVDPQQV